VVTTTTTTLPQAPSTETTPSVAALAPAAAGDDDAAATLEDGAAPPTTSTEPPPVATASVSPARDAPGTGSSIVASAAGGGAPSTQATTSSTTSSVPSPSTTSGAVTTTTTTTIPTGTTTTAPVPAPGPGEPCAVEQQRRAGAVCARSADGPTWVADAGLPADAVVAILPDRLGTRAALDVGDRVVDVAALRRDEGRWCVDASTTPAGGSPRPIVADDLHLPDGLRGSGGGTTTVCFDAGGPSPAWIGADGGATVAVFVVA